MSCKRNKEENISQPHKKGYIHEREKKWRRKNFTMTQEGHDWGYRHGTRDRKRLGSERKNYLGREKGPKAGGGRIRQEQLMRNGGVKEKSHSHELKLLEHRRETYQGGFQSHRFRTRKGTNGPEGGGNK